MAGTRGSRSRVRSYVDEVGREIKLKQDYTNTLEGVQAGKVRRSAKRAGLQL